MELKDISSDSTQSESHKVNTNNSRAIRPQIFIASACFLVSISLGMSMGYSAVLLPQLQEVNSSIFIDEDTGSWIATAYAVAGPAGSLVAGIVMDRWGRRTISFVGDAGMIVGWLLVCGAQSVSMLIVGRSIEGFARTMLATSLTVLIDELADPRFRGFTLSGIITVVSLGIMIIAGMGALLDWRMCAGVAAVVCLISILPFFYVTESPSWLVRKNKMEKAEHGLKWLCGTGRDNQAREELLLLKARFSTDSLKDAKSQKCLDMFREFTRPPIFKPFFILHFFNTIQVFCGVSIFTFYAIDILSKIRKATGAGIITDNVNAVIVSFVRVLGNSVTTLISIHVGRRTIALLSGFVSSFAALLLGIILLLHTTNNSFLLPETEMWLNYSLTFIFVGFNSLGLLILPVLMIGETQPAHVRSLVCGYIYTVNDFILGTVLKCYPSMLNSVDIHGLFIIFGISCLICSVFVYLFLPETQGKTLEQIEDYFRQPNVMWITRNRTSR